MPSPCKVFMLLQSVAESGWQIFCALFEVVCSVTCRHQGRNLEIVANVFTAPSLLKPQTSKDVAESRLCGVYSAELFTQKGTAVQVNSAVRIYKSE